VENIQSLNVPLNSSSSSSSLRVTIGKNAFKESKIQSITSQRTLNIAESAFELCESLKTLDAYTIDLDKITGYSNSTVIGNKAFKDSVLTDVKLSYVYEFGNLAFSDCKYLSTVTLNGIGKLDNYVFSGCSSLKSIDLNSMGDVYKDDGTVVHLASGSGSSYNYGMGTYDFENCTSLLSVTMPSGMVGISTGTFSGCTSLSDFKMDGTGYMSAICNNAFENCTSLRTLPEFKFLVKIFPKAFINCNNLTITLTRSVVFLDAESFSNCSNITINAPAGSEAFTHGCGDFKTAWNCTVKQIDDTIKDEEFLLVGYMDVTTVLYDFENRKDNGEPAEQKVTEIQVIYGYRGGFKTLTIPSDNEYYNIPMYDSWIGNSIYYRTQRDSKCSMVDYLEEINFGDVTSIGLTNSGSALSGCTALKKVVIGNKTEVIGKSAFSNCKALETVDIDGGLKCIKESAFSNCTALKHITLPASLNEIPDITIKKGDETTLNAIGKSAFSGCTALEEVTFTLPEDRTSKDIKVSIAETAFKGCTSLKEIILPFYSYYIGKSAFEGCTSLSNVQFRKKTNTVFETAFKGCTSLTAITLQPAMSIRESAFQGCNNITYIAIPPSTSTPPSTNAFSDCDKDKTFILCTGTEGDKGAEYASAANYKTITVSFEEDSLGDIKVVNKITFPNEIVVLKNGEKINTGTNISLGDNLKIYFSEDFSDTLSADEYNTDEIISSSAVDTVDETVSSSAVDIDTSNLLNVDSRDYAVYLNESLISLPYGYIVNEPVPVAITIKEIQHGTISFPDGVVLKIGNNTIKSGDTIRVGDAITVVSIDENILSANGTDYELWAGAKKIKAGDTITVNDENGISITIREKSLDKLVIIQNDFTVYVNGKQVSGGDIKTGDVITYKKPSGISPKKVKILVDGNMIAGSYKVTEKDAENGISVSYEEMPYIFGDTTASGNSTVSAIDAANIIDKVKNMDLKLPIETYGNKLEYIDLDFDGLITSADALDALIWANNADYEPNIVK
jgi:hypothetical protein